MDSRRTDVKSILLGAAEIIRRHGWVRLRYTDGKGFCLRGAIREYMCAVGLESQWVWDTTAEDLVRQKVLELYDIDEDVAHWNDAYCENKEQAIHVLEAAAGIKPLA